jgi:hypothetical protein
MSDSIERCAHFLAGHVEWARHKPWAGEFLADVDACLRIVRGLARGPAEQKYLGPCGAELADFEFETDTGTCEGDVYASRGSRTGRCRICGAEVSTDERAAWLDGQARSHAFRAAQIAEAYRVNVNTIRSWAARGQLVPHGHDAEDRPLFNVGDVLDLAAADAARRATEQAKRARRAAAKAAETEDAA